MSRLTNDAQMLRAVSRSGVARAKVKLMQGNLAKGSMSLPEISHSRSPQKSQRKLRWEVSRRLPQVPSEQMLQSPKTVRVDSALHKIRSQAMVQHKARACREKRKATKKKVPKSGIHRPRKVEASRFPVNYNVGFVPACVGHGTKGSAKGDPELKWSSGFEPAVIDMAKYLPIFFDGIRETQEPYRFVAVQGTLVSFLFCVENR